MLNIDHLTFRYGRRQAPVLEDFSLSLKAGGIYGLLGKNGAGKSTLLYLISGALTPQSGTVSFKGVNTRRRQPSTLSDLFLVPEEFTLPSISFAEYVKLNSAFYPRFSNEDLKRNVGTFDMDLEMNLGAASMGQKKKAVMCFALATNTSLLLMDEPPNGLDIPGKTAFRRFIASAMNDDRAIVISTHQVRDVDRLLDHIIIMDNHNVLLDQSVDEITSRLKFMVTDNQSLAREAIYAQPGLGGTQVVLPNNDGADTQMDLESLFELALTNPQMLNSFFPKESL